MKEWGVVLDTECKNEWTSYQNSRRNDCRQRTITKTTNLNVLLLGLHCQRYERHIFVL